MEEREYRDDEILTNYVWNNYQHLFTRLEQLGGKAVLSEDKASTASSPAMAEMLRNRWGAENDPKVLDALSDGVENFRVRVRDRVLREQSHQVFINRCPSCKRIVRTPRAKQCLWCGQAWHETV